MRDVVELRVEPFAVGALAARGSARRSAAAACVSSIHAGACWRRSIELPGELPQLRAFGVGGDERRTRRAPSVRAQRRVDCLGCSAPPLQPAACGRMRHERSVDRHACTSPRIDFAGHRHVLFEQGRVPGPSRDKSRICCYGDAMACRREWVVGYTPNRQAAKTAELTRTSARHDLNMSAAGLLHDMAALQPHRAHAASATSGPRRRHRGCRSTGRS